MTTTTFSRKTIAIALAAGVSLGGVTVPQFAGVQGMSAVASAESGNVPANDYIELDFTPTTSSGLVRSVDSDNNLTAYFGQKGATYNYKIPAETLTKAGIDPTKEFIVNERSDALVSVTTWDGNSGRPHKITKNETLKVSAGEAPHGITLTGFSGDTNQGTFAEIKQGDALLRVGRDTPDVYFQPFNSTVVKPGSQVQTKPQRIFGVKDLTHFSIVNNVPGASVDQNTGRLTYTPPANFSGGYVEIEVKATIDKNSFGDKYVSGDAHEAHATYRVYVEPQPQSDIYVSDVKKLDNGNYEVTRNDGEKWIIDLSDLNKAKKDIEGLKSKDEATQKEIDKIKEEITKLENSTIKEVKDNGDGTYTLIRKDGSEVPGKIDTSGSVTNVKTDGKGNLIITIDGTDKTVPLAQTTIKEANKGTPNHTVTITSPNGDTVTFNVFDKHVTDVKKLPNGNYEVTRNDGTKWTIDLKDIRDKIAELEKKESPSKDEFDKLKKELADLNIKVDNEFKNIDNRFNKVEGDITNLRSDLTKLEKRVTKIEARLTKVEGRTDALTKCVAGAGMAGIPALLSVPLMLMTQLNIPGIKDLNTQIQKQIGIYNPELARQWERNGGVLQAGATLAGLAGMIGGIAYIANQCDPMMQSDAAKETDLGQLSSKLGDAKAGSSKPEDKDKGSSVDAGSSTGDGSSTDAGSSTAEGSAKAE